MFEHAFGVETEDELGVELESLCESSCDEVGLVELQRTSSQQSREDPVVLEDPVELVLVNGHSIMLEGTSIQQSGEDPIALEDPVELASLDRILHDDTPEAEFCHVFHECEESVDFESCLGDSDVGDLVELAVDVDMCAAVTRSKQSNTEVAGAASDAMWWLVDSGASTHLINEETLQGVRVVSQTEHAGVDCVTATGASVGIRKSAVVQVEFRLDDPEGQTVLVELEVLVAPVRFNLLSLGRLLDRSWDVQFVPEFCVKAAKFSFLTRWKQNCGGLLSVPSVSSSASSVLGSQAPCGDGREGGGKQPVFSGAGVGLRGRALRGHRDHKRADQEDPCSKGGSQGTPKSAQCSSEGASQQQYRASGKEDAEEDRGPETTQDGPNAVASEVLCREETEQPQKGHLEPLQGQDPCPPLCHYAKPDERLTFSALEREMDRKLAAKEAPKRSLWDHLESHRQACMSALETPRLVAYNPLQPWAEEFEGGSSMSIYYAEKLMVTTVSKTAEFGTPALAGTDKAFFYKIPEPPKVPARKRLPTPPRRPQQGEAPMTPPRTPRTSTTPRTPGTASKASSPVAAVEIESHASWQYQDMD